MRARISRIAPAVDAHDETGLTALRRETLALLVVAIFILGCVGVTAILGTLGSSRSDPWNPTPLVEGLLGLMLTTMATYATLRLGPIGATAVLVTGLTLTLTGALFLNPGSSLANFFILIVLVATGVLDWRAGGATALLVSGVLVAMTNLAPGVIPPDVAVQSLLSIWMTLLLAWLLARPLRTALGWSLNSYELARAKTEEARQRQAELAQVSRGLEQACERLERLNEELYEAREEAEEAAANVAPLYAEAGLYLYVDVPTDLPRIAADPVRVRQVLINLLYNAVRFTHQGGVVVTAHLTDGEAVVTVHDSGVGIAPHNLEHLFEEFRQFQTPSRGIAGTGLGLAVCKRFVELHGGTIWAESEPDAGTTISFALPLHGNVAAVPFHSLPWPGATGDRSGAGVAILDPSGETARLVQRYLDGYHVREVKRLEQTSDLAQRGELRAMIVTSASARQHWFDYQSAHADVRAVPTIVYPLRTRETTPTTLRATAYHAKPVRLDQLAKVVRRLHRPLHHLLVIEDDPDMRTLLVRMLRSLSRQAVVDEAPDGMTGLQLIRRSRPDAVLLDLLMPETDGYAVLQALQDDRELREIPVIIISARGPQEEVLVDVVGITRSGGLTVGEATAYLKASLDALHHPAPAIEPAAAHAGMVEASPVGSPA